MLDNKLIESALQLTGKTMEDMEVIVQEGPCQCSNDTHYINWEFSIEKFSYYLLSPSFIEKYEIYYPPYINKGNWIAKDFGQAIYEYQSGNEEPLIELLKPLCKTTNND